MAITHNAVVVVPDDGTSPVGSDEWNAAHTIGAGTVTDTHVAAANKDGAAGTASMRTLGTSAAAACAGNDARLSDARQIAAGTDKTKLDAIDASPPYAIVVSSDETPVPSGVWTSVSFGTTPALLTDPSGFYSASYPTRLTVPAGMGGLYQVVGCLIFNPNSTGTRIANIRLNGAVSEVRVTAPTLTAQYPVMNPSVFMPLAPGDYLELQGYQDSGAVLYVTPTLPTYPRLSLCRLSKTT